MRVTWIAVLGAKMTWLSAIGLALKYWKNIVTAIGGIVVGFGIAWHIQGIRVDRGDAKLQKKEVEVARLASNLEDCQDANALNTKTIRALKGEVNRVNSLCASRLKVKDSVIDKLKEIQGLKTEGKNEKGNIVSGDALLDRLNGMFDNAKTNNKN